MRDHKRQEEREQTQEGPQTGRKARRRQRKGKEADINMAIKEKREKGERKDRREGK